MLYFRRSRVLRFVILPLALVSLLSACYTWVPLKPPVARALAETESGSVRITLADGSRVVLKTGYMEIEGDSLYASDEPTRPVTLPLRDVLLVEEKKSEGGNTLLLIGGLVLYPVVIFFTIFSLTNGD